MDILALVTDYFRDTPYRYAGYIGAALLFGYIASKIRIEVNNERRYHDK